MLHIKNFTIEHTFLIIVLSVGTLLVFLKPPLEMHDATTHYISISGLSKGFTDAVELSNVEVNFAKQYPFYNRAVLFQTDIGHNGTWESIKYAYQMEVLDTDERTLVKGQSDYKTCYIPQAIGFSIGQLFSDRPLVWMYCGRVLNLLAYIIIAFWALKTLKHFKYFFATICLMPGFVTVAATLHPDNLLNVSFLLFSAYFINFIFDSLDPKEHLIFPLFALFSLLLKPPYFLITMVPLCSVLKSSKLTKNIKLASLGALMVILSLFSLKVYHIYNRSDQSEIKQVENSTQAKEFIDVLTFTDKNHTPADQIKYILSKPLTFPKAVVNSWLSPMSTYYVNSFFWGGRWITVPPAKILMFLYIMTIFVITLANNQLERSTVTERAKRNALIYFVIAIMVSAIIWLGMYVAETRMNKLGDYMVFGIQGRYFLPFSIFLFAPLLTVKRIPFNQIFSRIGINLKKVFVCTQMVVWLFVIGHLFYIFYINSSANYEIGRFHHDRLVINKK